MQKKVVGILASVAAAHAVLVIGVFAGGGCRQSDILAPHTYNEGPEFLEPSAAVSAPAVPAETTPPVVPGGETAVAPVAAPPAPVYNPPVPVPVEPEPKAAASATVYKVKRGDTLSVIAFKHGVSLQALAAANNLSGKAMNNLRVGQSLNIPEGGVYNPDRKMKRRAPAAKKTAKKTAAKSAVKAELPADGVHVVKSGDSLDRIGRRYGVTAAAIAKENNIALSKVLQIGDKLRIPGKASAAAPTATPTATPTVPTVSNTDVDDLDPNIGLSAAETGTAAAPAAAETVTAAAAAPAAAETVTAAESRTETFTINSDTTVEDFCQTMDLKVEDFRKLNPNLPADGKLKGGSYVQIPAI